MNFYDKYLLLCKERKITPSRAAIEMNINKGTISVWKAKNNKGEDVKPSTPVVDKMVAYFGVTADYLLGNIEDSHKTKEKPATISDDGLDDEIIRLIGVLRGDRQKAAVDYLRFLVREQEAEGK